MRTWPEASVRIAAPAAPPVTRPDTATDTATAPGAELELTALIPCTAPETSAAVIVTLALPDLAWIPVPSETPAPRPETDPAALIDTAPAPALRARMPWPSPEAVAADIQIPAPPAAFSA